MTAEVAGTLRDPVPAATAVAVESGAVMSLVDHLSELRGRLIWSIVAVAAGLGHGARRSDSRGGVARPGAKASSPEGGPPGMLP